MRSILILAIMAVPALAFGQTDPAATDPSQLMALVQTLIDAVKLADWTMAIGLGITLAVAAARWLKLLNRLPKSSIKWVAGGVAVLSVVGVGLQAGDSVMDMVMNGFKAAATAVGGWEFLLEPVLEKVGLKERVQGGVTPV